MILLMTLFGKNLKALVGLREGVGGSQPTVILCNTKQFQLQDMC